jgi:hypothetical protein
VSAVRPRRTFFDDLVGLGVPDEGLGVVVPVLDPDFDGVGESGQAAEHASAEHPVGELLEPPFHQI